MPSFSRGAVERFLPLVSPLLTRNAWGWTSKWLPIMTLPSLMKLRLQSIRDRKNLPHVGRTLTLTLRDPFEASVVIREFGTDVGVLEEVFAREVYGPVLKHLGDCRSIVDLGANIGFATLYFAAHYKNSSIVAVEPDPDNFALLTRNLQSIAAERLKTFRNAVWSSDRLLSLVIPSTGAYCGIAIQEQPDLNSGTPLGVTTQGMTMAQLFSVAGCSRVDLLKIDIEGTETELFRSDLAWLDSVGAIAIEFHGAGRAQSGFDAKMAARGFRVVAETPHTILAVR